MDKDWLSMIIAILVFVLPAIFENDKKKKRRKKPRTEEEPLPELMEAEPPLYQPAVPEPEPISVSVSDSDSVSAQAPAPVPDPAPAADAPAVPHTGAHQTVSRRKRRFNARDMVIYSEIMHPKYLEN